MPDCNDEKPTFEIKQGVRFSFAWLFLLPDLITPESQADNTATVTFVPSDGATHRTYPASGSITPTAVSPSVIPNRFDLLLEDTDTAAFTERSGVFALSVRNAAGHVVEQVSDAYTVTRSVL